VLTATRRPQAADREPGGFACKLVLKPRSRSGRCIGPVQTLAGARVCGPAGAPPAPQMWRCPEPAQRIPDVRSISPPQHRAHAATGRSLVAACARCRPADPGPDPAPGPYGCEWPPPHAIVEARTPGYDTATEVACWPPGRGG